jgi:hypothetical protein
VLIRGLLSIIWVWANDESSIQAHAVFFCISQSQWTEPSIELSEQSSFFTMASDHIGRVIELIVSGRTQDQIQASSQLSKLLEEEHWALQSARQPEIVQRLLDLAARSTSNVQTRICTNIQKLTQYEGAVTILMEKPQFLEILHEHLRSQSKPHLRTFASAILANVSLYPENAKAIIEKDDLVPAILDATMTDANCRAFVCDAVYNLCHTPSTCLLISPLRNHIINSLTPLLDDKDPRVGLCATLSIINALDRNAPVADHLSAHIFSQRTVTSIISALNASLYDHDYLGNTWHPLGCIFSLYNMSFFHKSRLMLERRDVFHLLLLAAKLYSNHDAACNADVAVLASETMLNILTCLQRSRWSYLLGGDEASAWNIMRRVGGKLDSVLESVLAALPPTSIESVKALTDLLTPSGPRVNPAAISAISAFFGQSRSFVEPLSFSPPGDVLAEIISKENSQLLNDESRVISSARRVKVNTPTERLMPGQKRCPTCGSSSPVRASKCNSCQHCYYLSVSPYGSTKQVGKGHKVCPACTVTCAAKRSRCPQCNYMYFPTKRPLPESSFTSSDSSSLLTQVVDQNLETETSSTEASDQAASD